MAAEQENSYFDLQIIRGCPFPPLKWLSKKNIEDVMDYVPEDDDIIVASFPKTGTTWIQYIILQIISKGSYFPSFDDTTFKVAPFLEMAGIAALEAMTKPRLYKHHIAYNLVKKNEKAKCVYIYRNPEDTVVSFFNFSQSMNPEVSLDFKEYFENFVTGNIGYGNYFQHVLSFYDHRDDPNLLMVSYEKLHANRKEEILRIAKFLGDQYHADLLENEEVVDNIMRHTSFDYMKKNLYLTRPDLKKKDLKSKDCGDKPKEENQVIFFRKGIVGDGKNALTEEQQQRIKAAAEKVLKGTDILKEWYCE